MNKEKSKKLRNNAKTIYKESNSPRLNPPKDASKSTDTLEVLSFGLGLKKKYL